MIDVEALNGYLQWKRDKELYPPTWSPEDYVQHILNVDARTKLDMLHEVLENGTEYSDKQLLVIIREVLSNE